MGMPLAAVALHFGANDVQGTVMRETIFHAAGARHRDRAEGRGARPLRPRRRADPRAARHALQRAAALVAVDIRHRSARLVTDTCVFPARLMPRREGREPEVRRARVGRRGRESPRPHDSGAAGARRDGAVASTATGSASRCSTTTAASPSGRDDAVVHLWEAERRELARARVGSSSPSAPAPSRSSPGRRAAASRSTASTTSTTSSAQATSSIRSREDGVDRHRLRHAASSRPSTTTATSSPSSSG